MEKKVDLRTSEGQKMREEEVLRRKEEMLKLGIQPKNIEKFTKHQSELVNPQKIQGVIEVLSNRGITDPSKVINSNIFIITLTHNTIDEHLSYLEEKFKESFH
jgi:transcriptional regulatory protein LevR